MVSCHRCRRVASRWCLLPNPSCCRTGLVIVPTCTADEEPTMMPLPDGWALQRLRMRMVTGTGVGADVGARVGTCDQIQTPERANEQPKSAGETCRHTTTYHRGQRGRYGRRCQCGGSGRGLWSGRWIHTEWASKQLGHGSPAFPDRSTSGLTRHMLVLPSWEAQLAPSWAAQKASWWADSTRMRTELTSAPVAT